MGKLRIRKKDAALQRSVAFFFPTIDEVMKWQDPTIQQHPDADFRQEAMWFRYNFEKIS